jgi:hypothetical protein
LLKALRRIAEQDRYPVTGQRLEYRRRHLVVEWRQNLILQLDNGRSDVASHKVLDKFQTDEAGAHDDGPLDASIDSLFNTIHVVKISERKYLWQITAWNWRTQGSGAGG